MAQAVGSLVIRTGHRVMMSNSRGPQSLSGLRDAMGCETGSAADAAAFADIAFAAIPLRAWHDYEFNFQGMTAEPEPLNALLAARERMVHECCRNVSIYKNTSRWLLCSSHHY